MSRHSGKEFKLLSGRQMAKIVRAICRKILREHRDADDLAFIGIRTRGLYLARRARDLIRKETRREIPVGAMDISLYRDDLNALVPAGTVDHTDIPFDVNDRHIVLFDDVLHTGRTVRAAVDHLIDLGRPKTIHLAVLIDRGGRELPIAANFTGKRLSLPRQASVKVKLKEVDRVDAVVVSRSETAAR